MIGFIAAFCTTFAFLPQVIKVIKYRETKALSLAMFLLQTMGLTLWLIHGIMINDLPIIFANTLSVVFSAIILFYKLKYK